MKAEATWLWVNSRHPFGTLTFSIAKVFVFVLPLLDWAKVLGRWSLVVGYLLFVICYWSFVIGPWGLGVGPWSLSL